MRASMASWLATNDTDGQLLATDTLVWLAGQVVDMPLYQRVSSLTQSQLADDSVCQLVNSLTMKSTAKFLTMEVSAIHSLSRLVDDFIFLVGKLACRRLGISARSPSPCVCMCNVCLLKLKCLLRSWLHALVVMISTGKTVFSLKISTACYAFICQGVFQCEAACKPINCSVLSTFYLLDQ